MAIAFGSLLTSGGTGGTNSFTTASITPVSGNLTLVTVFFRNNTNAGITVTGTNGWNVTWTKLSITNYSGTEVFIFYGFPSSNTSGTLTVGTANGTNDAVYAVQHFSGVDSSAPITQVNYATGSSAALSVTLASSPASTSATFGFGYRNSTVTFTPGSGFTEIADTYGSASRAIATEYDLTTPGTTVNMTANTSGTWHMVGLELKEYVVPLSTGNFFLLF